MIFFLYSDKNAEHQAEACLLSIADKITDDVKIVYYTIGFESNIVFKNLYKIKIPYKPQYPTFHYYKAELSLVTMKMFPGEHYMFSDTDILYSKRFSFENMKSNLEYPMASFGPHEYPFIWNSVGSNTTIYNEEKLMKYFNVSQRSQRYVWSCMYTFSENAIDFFEEYTSMCNNRYLLDRRYDYYPMHDEIPFNICLWKRGATQNLGFSFLNTHLLNSVKSVEECDIKDKRLGQNIDTYGSDWEYIHDSSKVIAYHGFKEKDHINQTLDYLIKKR